MNLSATFRQLLLLGAFAAIGFGLARTCIRGCSCGEAPGAVSEIAWMKAEYRLDDAAFAKIEALHEAYVPRCEQYCAAIAEAAENVRELAARQGHIDEVVKAALREEERSRAACREALLHHLYQTAGCMPEEQGRRFLATALPRIFNPGQPDVHKAVAH